MSSNIDFHCKVSKEECLSGSDDSSSAMVTARKRKCPEPDLVKLTNEASKCHDSKFVNKTNMHSEVKIKDEKLDYSTENCSLSAVRNKLHDAVNKSIDTGKSKLKAVLKCEQSNETLNASETGAVNQCKKERKYQCSICYRLFGYFGMFQKHMRTHADATDYSCCVCSKAFIELQDLFIHFSDVHPEFEKVFCKRKQFGCSLCEKRFKSACHLTNHVRTHTGEKPYACVVCNATFVELSGLNRHKKRSHAGLSRQEYEQRFSFICDECPKRFDSKQRLVLHRENHYKTFKCDKCDQGFLTAKSLECHTKRMHYTVKDQTNAWGSGKSKYTCGWCSRRFKCATHLENHERIHSGIRPFACDICDRKFAEVGGLRRHNRLMHVKKNSVSTRTDRPFKCEDCGKCFKDLALLKSHSSIHVIDKPYQCHICGVRFVKSKEVVKHKQIQHSDNTDVLKMHENNSWQQFSTDSTEMGKRSIAVQTPIEGYFVKSKSKKIDIYVTPSSDLDQVPSMTSDNKSYMCGLCGESFGDILSRFQHMKTHENNDTSHDVSLQLHQKVLHKNKTNQDSSSEDNDSKKNVKSQMGNGMYNSSVSESQIQLNSDVDESKIQLKSDVDESKIQLNSDNDSFVEDISRLYNYTNIVQPTKERPYQCDHCRKTFIRAIHLHNHIMTHTGERPFKCDQCGKGFIECSKLARHNKTHQKKMTKTNSSGLIPNTKNDIQLQSQNPANGRPIDDPYSKDFDSSNMTVQKKRNKFHFCHGCKQTYTHTENLALHIKYNTENGPSECTVCLAKFGLKCELDKHLRKHMIRKVMVTKKQKPHRQKIFPCELCGVDKVFTSRANLKAHMRVHTGERPYVCDVLSCGMAFKQQCQKTRHMRTHTGEREFVCEFCGKDYADPATLKGHIRIHTGDKRHKCEVCEKAFTESCKLTRHRRVHTGEKPYKCSFCGNLFTSSGNLRDHERIHTGEMPYRCDVCHRGFAHPSKLLYHRKTHMPDFASEPI